MKQMGIISVVFSEQEREKNEIHGGWGFKNQHVQLEDLINNRICRNAIPLH